MIEALRQHIVVVVISLLAFAGCRQEMADQPRYEAYEASGMFQDSMAMRRPVAGTVPREAIWPGTGEADTSESVGAEAGSAIDSSTTQSIPFAITRTVLERGRGRFNIYCAPCHGRAGDGQGIIVQRGLRAPPSFHTERLRAAPDGHFYHVITSGFGAMFSYASRVAPADRWAIVAYVRALQMSQHARRSTIPADSIVVRTPEGR